MKNLGPLRYLGGCGDLFKSRWGASWKKAEFVQNMSKQLVRGTLRSFWVVPNKGIMAPAIAKACKGTAGHVAKCSVNLSQHQLFRRTIDDTETTIFVP